MAKAFQLGASGAEAIERAAAGYEARAARATDLSRPLGLLGTWHVRKAAKILDTGERGISSRTRQLSRSLTYAVGGNELSVGSNKVYAGSQQFGPRGGFYESSRPNGMLAIPIADNLGARQNPRFNSPRDVPDGFFVRTAKHLLFVRRRTRKGREPRGRRSAFHRSMGAQVARFQDLLEVLFLIVPRVAGIAHRYITHDPADQAAWDRFATRWIVEGK